MAAGGHRSRLSMRAWGHRQGMVFLDSAERRIVFAAGGMNAGAKQKDKSVLKALGGQGSAGWNFAGSGRPWFQKIELQGNGSGGSDLRFGSLG